MGRAVHQFEKEVSFKLGRICYIELYGTRRPPVREGSLSASLEKKLVLNQKQN